MNSTLNPLRTHVKMTSLSHKMSIKQRWNCALRKYWMLMTVKQRWNCTLRKYWMSMAVKTEVGLYLEEVLEVDEHKTGVQTVP